VLRKARRLAVIHKLRLLHDLHVLHGRSSGEALTLAWPGHETEACMAGLMPLTTLIARWI
jgi:hypothetical protein